MAIFRRVRSESALDIEDNSVSTASPHAHSGQRSTEYLRRSRSSLRQMSGRLTGNMNKKKPDTLINNLEIAIFNKAAVFALYVYSCTSYNTYKHIKQEQL